jgi:hypothetical protein
MCWIETDLSPENMLAMYLLAKRKIFPTHIVIGDGNPHIKIIRLKSYIRFLKKEGLFPKDLEPIIIQGLSSEKIYASCDDYVEMLNNYNKTGAMLISLKLPHELHRFHSQLMLNNITAYFSSTPSIPDYARKFKQTFIYDYRVAHRDVLFIDDLLFQKTWKAIKQSSSVYIDHLMQALQLSSIERKIKLRSVLATMVEDEGKPLEECAINAKFDADKFNQYHKMYKAGDNTIMINPIGLVLQINNGRTIASSLSSSIRMYCAVDYKAYDDTISRLLETDQ